MKHEIKLFVNDIPYNITVNSQDTLLYALRDILHLTGTKKGCGEGECGACTVIMDGEAVRSCLILAVEADGKKIITIEGVSANGKLSRVQRAFVEAGAIPSAVSARLDSLWLSKRLYEKRRQKKKN